jgi:hypothetical protein
MRRRIAQRRRARLVAALAVGIGVVLGCVAGAVFTSTLNVASSVAYDKQHTMAISDLIPSGCAPIAGSITNIVNTATNTALWGSNAANQSTLWLWNSENQTTSSGGSNMNGGNGADCMVPGGVRSGATLTVGGGKGTDYCYTGPGPGGYTRNSCNNNPLFATPYLTSAVASPTFA